MWWCDVKATARRVTAALEQSDRQSSHVDVAPDAVLDETNGPIVLGQGTRVCPGAILVGPIVIGSNSMIGSRTFLRGPLLLGNDVSVGYCTELKHSLIASEVSIGPMCFVADSRIDRGAYLGAMVRTSNQRLDKQEIQVSHEGAFVPTGLAKLGCWIGEYASLGIQVIVLPGRVVAAGSLIEPRITVIRNWPRGHYRAVQTIEIVKVGDLA